MKRPVAAIAAALVLLLGLSGCGEVNSTQTQPANKLPQHRKDLRKTAGATLLNMWARKQE